MCNPPFPVALGSLLLVTCMPSDAQTLKCKTETIGVGESRAGCAAEVRPAGLQGQLLQIKFGDHVK